MSIAQLAVRIFLPITAWQCPACCVMLSTDLAVKSYRAQFQEELIKNTTFGTCTVSVKQLTSQLAMLERDSFLAHLDE